MFQCTKCGNEVSTPSHKCPRCFSSGTLITVEPALKALPVPVTNQKQERIPTGFENINRMIGGGLKTKSFFCFSAGPGTGKTTVLSQIAAYLRKKGYTVYFFTGEETPELVLMRAERLGISDSMPEMLYRKDIRELSEIVRRNPPNVLIIDSIQSTLGSQSSRLTYEELTANMILIRRLTDTYNIATCVTVQVNKDLSFSGPKAIEHYCDVFIVGKKGINDEVIFTTPTKNRLGSTNNRAVFRMTGAGLIELDERETSYILRHQTDSTVGLAAFMADTIHGLTVDEITVNKNGEDKLVVDGRSGVQANFLLTVIQNYFPDFSPYYIARANLSEKLPKNADLAIIMAVLSKYYGKPINRNTVFIASVDASGTLLPVPDMGTMVQRAKDQGYSRVIGAKPIGSQQATWEAADTIKDVWNLF